MPSGIVKSYLTSQRKSAVPATPPLQLIDTLKSKIEATKADCCKIIGG